MRDVYSRARAVVVWMGPATPETDVFFAEFQEMRVKLKTWKAKYDADPELPDPDMEERPRHGDAFWGGLSRLLGNEWFRRLWTYQEIILPSSAALLCGDLWADFDQFVNFLMDGWIDSTYFLKASTIAFGTNDKIASRTCHSIKWYRDLSARNRHAKETQAHYVVIELSNLRERRVKEPIDRVWAIVGLLQRDLRDRLSSCVDYSSKGREEYWKTWIMFAKALIEEPGGMRLLHIPPTREPKPPHLPSWCPNLSGESACRMTIDGRWNDSISEQGSYIRWAFFEENSREKSPARREATWNHEKKLVTTVMHDNVLRVRGFVVDTIEEVVEHEIPLDVIHDSYDLNSEEHMALYNVAVDRHLKSLDLARCVFYGKSEGVPDIPDDFIVSLFLDSRITERAKDIYHKSLRKWKTWHCKSTDYSWGEARCHDQFSYIRGHTFFSTKGGRVG
jgi:hypothetical protein